MREFHNGRELHTSPVWKHYSLFVENIDHDGTVLFDRVWTMSSRADIPDSEVIKKFLNNAEKELVTRDDEVATNKYIVTRDLIEFKWTNRGDYKDI